MQCPHAEQGTGRQVCPHLLQGLSQTLSTEQFGHYRRFTGHSLDYVLTCPACKEQPITGLSWVCGECFVDIAHGSRLGTLGRPELPQQDSSLQLHTLDHLPPEARLLQVVPFERGWAALTDRNDVILLDSGRRKAFHLSDWDLPLYEELTLVAHDPYLAIASTFGTRGVVVDTLTGQVTMRLERPEQPACRYPLAFTNDGQLVHGEQISDPADGKLLQTLKLPENYYPSGMTASTDWIVMNGWTWHPIGQVRVAHRQQSQTRVLCQRDGLVDGTLLWLGPAKLGVWGLGALDVMLLPGLRIFDLETQQELPPVSGPEGPFAFDQHLFCYTADSGFSVWDLETHRRIFHDAKFHPLAYHPELKIFLAQTDKGLTINRLA